MVRNVVRNLPGTCRSEPAPEPAPEPSCRSEPAPEPSFPEPVIRNLPRNLPGTCRSEPAPEPSRSLLEPAPRKPPRNRSGAYIGKDPIAKAVGELRSLEKKFTFPGKNIYSPWKRNLGSSGPVVLWSAGPVVLWSCGPLVLWSCGPLVLWSCGPVVLCLWSCGRVVLWPSGPVVPWQRREKKYVGTKKAWKECKRK